MNTDAASERSRADMPTRALGIHCPVSPIKTPRVQTPVEELLNALTHGVATLAAVVVFIVLLSTARRGRSGHASAALAVYAGSLVLLYSASTCYHAARSRKWKRLFRSADHAAIYLLIAGTYTPVMLLLVGGWWAVAVVATLWSAAAIGVVFNVAFVGRFPGLSIVLYVAMGWAGLAAIHPILTHVPPGCLAWIIIGGVLYTGGIIFYKWKNLKFHHAIWHLFVIAGSAAHFIAINHYILQPLAA